MDSAAFTTASLRDYIGVLRRRRWLIIEALVLVPLIAVAVSLHQPKLYQATSEVLLNQQNLAGGLNGAAPPAAGSSPDRVAQTQAAVARVPAVAWRVLRVLHLNDRTPEQFLAQSAVVARTDADLLIFSVTDGDRRVAQQLATTYAQQFTQYRRHLDTAAIVAARKGIQARIGQLRKSGDNGSALYQSLLQRDQELATMGALETSYFVIRGADSAARIAPRPFRNGIFGLALGLVLGLGLAFLREALDTRIRTADELIHRLHLPLLARLPAPSRRLRKHNDLAMVCEPAGRQAEPFRMLRTNLEFARFDRSLRTLLVTSAVEKEGKSTTAANLAVALARAGHRIILLDLDLRRPHVERFFDLEGKPGVTEVVLGKRTLDEALVNQPFLVKEPPHGLLRKHPRVLAHAFGDSNGSRPPGMEGRLDILPCGALPPEPGEFVGSDALRRLLDELASRADLVIIDSPPLLNVGDAMTISGLVDGLLLVCRANVIRRPMLLELQRLLRATPSTAIGFVLTDAEEEDAYSYAYGYGDDAPSERLRTLTGR